MTNVNIYTDTAILLEKVADELETTVAEVVTDIINRFLDDRMTARYMIDLIKTDRLASFIANNI